METKESSTPCEGFLEGPEGVVCDWRWSGMQGIAVVKSVNLRPINGLVEAIEFDFEIRSINEEC